MNATAESQASPARTEAHPLAALFVLVLMIIGCGLLWVGVPIGSMWLAGELTDTGAHAAVALVLIVGGMFLVSLILAWLNELYLRVTGPNATLVRGLPVRRRGPLEPLLAICFVLALAGLTYWFFFLAENPGNGVFGAG